ncbi:DNA-3-methyladenine glycosylase family protein [Halalkalicoccus jeotgali]|uniref:DNA-(apurinic or apyrimidinic site) lyase n=1 Tax=Halalkalicoccus jeotgali (strain DSM 18796 / CECT 7217 / JCM 14584 / KCTC 4019 / B3) TaxID=795797 RepID=D8J3D5_HALJB|nr:DNA glycosylase [Halalkalicoccus jeotgali]ADJ15242.1 8-oxoguanine DNA glycosylase domain protein [Halalkalicoccus jeotgali B3]ELY35337.1 8-oxoguanine DNA glycosylase domain-containing protein [Halalkalicoccus jeotgali B3]
MERGTIPLETCPGGLDLRATLESGQSYRWRREDGLLYEGVPGGWYHTVLDGNLIRVRQTDRALEWESTTDAVPYLRRLLRLDDDLDAIVGTGPDDPLLCEAYAAHRGLRIVNDPVFACLISFICSAQMRVGRIHGMQTTLADRFGASLDVDGRTYHAFPTPDQLASTSVEELRDCSLGYRAPYVKRTAEMVAGGEAHPAEARGLDYETAREFLTRFVGVGNKVADCVLLFSLGYLEAVPLDTWIRSAIEEYYPECDRDSYRETSRAIRERLGGEYAGYAQTYVFHHLRTAGTAEAGE